MANLFDNAPEGQPDSFVTGDYVTFKRSDIVADYPTSLYSAQYIARGRRENVNEFTITSSKEDGHFLFTADNSVTSLILPEQYGWQLEITRDSDGARVVIDRGIFNVLPDYDTAGSDFRSHAEIMLTKIEAVLEGKADSDVMEYEINGRSLKKFSFRELRDIREEYKAEAAREKAVEDAKQGRAGPSTIKVRF